ncbi:MAG: MATE family efflux transporter [Clostridia bacterium]
MAKRINLLEGNIALSLTKLAIPIMGMSLLQMAYNLTDMFWIGKLGSGPVASIGTGGMIGWLFMGIHSVAQIGGQVHVAKSLGAGKHKEAGKFAHAAIILSLSLTITLALLTVIFINPIINVFGLNDPQIILDAKNYVLITCGFGTFTLMSKLLISLTTATGDSKTPFIATTVGLVFNIVLDPVLIFGFGFIPAMGVIGAAIATIVAQFLMMLILVIHALKDTHLFCHVKMKTLPEFDKILQIIKLAYPIAIQETLYPIFSIAISRLIAGFGDSAVAVQRIGSQLESVSWMVTGGFAMALNSFIAQNHGAKNYIRAKQGFKQAFILLSIYGIIVSLLLIFCAKPLFCIFLQEEEVVAMGVNYLVIFGATQLFLCWEIIASNTMNAFGKTLSPALASIIITAMRIPASILLSSTDLALNGIWVSVSASTLVKALVLMILILIFLKKLPNTSGKETIM